MKIHTSLSSCPVFILLRNGAKLYIDYSCMRAGFVISLALLCLKVNTLN